MCSKQHCKISEIHVHLQLKHIPNSKNSYKTYINVKTHQKMTSVSFQASYDRLNTQGVDFKGHNSIWGTYPMGVLLNHRTFGHDFPEFRLFFSPFLHMLGNFFREFPRIGPWSSHHYLLAAAAVPLTTGIYYLTGYQG